MVGFDQSAIQQGTDSQIELWGQRVIRVILMDVTDFREAIPAESEVPHSVIVAITFFEQMRPLLT